MISDSKLTDYAYLVSARYEAINTHYIKLMAKQIKEIGQLSPSNLFRLQQMAKMQQNISEINTLLSQETGRTLNELYKIYDMSGMSLYGDTYNLYTAKGVKQVPFEENVNIQRYLESVKQLTANTFINMSNTTALYEPYKHLVDTAIDAVVNGVSSYDEIIRKQLTDSSLSPLVRNADEGLRITYASGLTRRLDSAVRMNVLDGIREVNNGIREQVGKEFGADGVEITVHALCAADHIDIQGKQFSKEEFERVNNSLKRRISTCNCKHSTFPIILGISQPTYTNEELAQYKANSEQIVNIDGKKMTKYEATQLQRKVETEIRKAKDKVIFAENLGDDELLKQAKSRVQVLKKHYNNISAQAGLTPKMDRTYVQGYSGKQITPKSITLSYNQVSTAKSTNIIEAIHITNENNIESILSKGFNLDRVGVGAGTTWGEGIYFSNDTFTQKYYKGRLSSDVGIQSSIDTTNFLQLEFIESKSEIGDKLYQQASKQLKPDELKEFNKLKKTMDYKSAFETVVKKHYDGIIINEIHDREFFDWRTGGDQIVVFNLNRIKSSKKINIK